MLGNYLVTTIAGLGGVLIGSGFTIYNEREGRKWDQTLNLRSEKRKIYSDFLVCVARWQNELMWRWEKKHNKHMSFLDDSTVQIHELESLESREGLGTNRSVEEAQQATMSPLFQIRMLGSPEVIVAADLIIANMYERKKEFSTHQPDFVLLRRKWYDNRDGFIECVRKELEA